MIMLTGSFESMSVQVTCPLTEFECLKLHEPFTFTQHDDSNRLVTSRISQSLVLMQINGEKKKNESYLHKIIEFNVHKLSISCLKNSMRMAFFIRIFVDATLSFFSSQHAASRL